MIDKVLKLLRKWGMAFCGVTLGITVAQGLPGWTVALLSFGVFVGLLSARLTGVTDTEDMYHDKISAISMELHALWDEGERWRKS